MLLVAVAAIDLAIYRNPNTVSYMRFLLALFASTAIVSISLIVLFRYVLFFVLEIVMGANGIPGQD